MLTCHDSVWPKGLPHRIRVPRVTLNHNLDVAAARYPDKPAIIFYDSVLTYAELRAQADAMAAFLQQRCGVRRGDRVLIMSQNCPQFVVAYYAILRAEAVVVPVNAMSTENELRHYISDSGARMGFAAQELLPRIRPCVEPDGLRQLIVHAYADALQANTDLAVPGWVSAPAETYDAPGLVAWRDALAAGLRPAPSHAQPGDVCVLPYTSGTTGRPKGCRHTHETLQAAALGSVLWRGMTAESVFLAVAPMFHLLGMQNGMHMPLLLGATVVMLPRWDNAVAAALIERCRVSVWVAPPAMLVDFFAHPDARQRDLSSLTLLCGGGAAMPEAVAAMLKERFGIVYSEGYGMTETASFLHANPLARPKRQCLGIPAFGVDSRIVEPGTRRELPAGEVGELVTHGAQVMLGYWNNPQADQEAFIEMDGKRFFRTGDLAAIDEDGYFFMRDRLKRMINVSGYKVWPAEVESDMYQHPAIHEACVVSVGDARRGETVKALVVLKPGYAGQVGEADIIAWCRERMAVYKAPRIVEFIDKLPKSATGKILWRKLQEDERQRTPS